jgi:hypothetical protein
VQKEVFNKLAALQVAEQVFGIELCIQVPFLALTMFMTELTHFSPRLFSLVESAAALL